MSTAEKIIQELQTLPEVQAREVLDFVAFLKTRRAQGKTVLRTRAPSIALARCTTVDSTTTGCMTAKSFVDTNVVLYTIGKDARKADLTLL